MVTAVAVLKGDSKVGLRLGLQWSPQLQAAAARAWMRIGPQGGTRLVAEQGIPRQPWC